MLALHLAVATASARAVRPTLHFDLPPSQATLGVAFDRALDTLLDISTVPSDPKVYNKTGLMKENRFFRAGGGYAQPWTRDAAVNAWNAGSLFKPDVARDTLWAVTVPEQNGLPIVQRDNQWWDKVVWIVGAWSHYRTTGDLTFLTTAYGVSERLLREMRATRYSAKDGLFQGPSFFNDGIAGYPAPPAEPDDAGSSFVLDHEGTDRLMALSTNCLYVGAYRAASAMAKELGRTSREWDRAANTLRTTINRRFWVPDKGLYGYLLDPAGKLDRSQEGCGLAFAILFNVADPARARSILTRAHVEPFGMTDVYPRFSRFTDERPGRHNAIVWPIVQGLWARAAAVVRNSASFRSETENLARLSAGSDGRFYEIYNAKTGKVDGGWQNGRPWGSEPDQTWSATAYLSMITNGLFGMRFERKGLRFAPLVPRAWGGTVLNDLHYRGATLEIRLRGSGQRVASVLLDGKRVSLVPSTLTGRHTVTITVH